MFIQAILGAVIGAVMAVPLFSVCLKALGFTEAGIVLGSLAAKMMSTAAAANGGGVASGSLVAILQSLGTGLSTMVNVILGGLGSAIGAIIGLLF